jgi:Protein of unknown function (DUF2934)
MDRDREALIRKRAYEIWEREGRSGDPEDHWVRAEREIDADASQTSVGEALPTDSVAAADSAIR